MNPHPWVSFLDQRPPTLEQIEVWDDYEEQVLSGEYVHYDGRWIRIKMRHWYIEESVLGFSHWRLPEPEAERPKPIVINQQGAE